MDSIFIQLAIILLVAFVVSYIARIFKQPIIIGYILAGIIISPFILASGASTEIITTFSELGIAFLLFMVGLHLNPKVIKEIGASSLIIGSLQILITFIVSFLVSFKLLGYDLVTSAFIGIVLSFSSTIIIMKLLSDERQLDSLYGKMSIGVLIIQDLVAVAVIMFISSLGNGTTFSTFAVQGLLSGLGLIVLLFLVGMFVLPSLTKNIAKSQELLFLFSITWAFLIAGLFYWRGFSIEIGALIAGVVLSITPYSVEISSKVRPLRDFFLIIFFIILGLKIDLSGISKILSHAIIFSVIALAIKPLIIMILMRQFGYTKRNNFLTGTTLAQISEFSIIVLGIGIMKGYISEGILSTMTFTMIITVALSSYMIINSNLFYSRMARFAALFEKKGIKEKRKIQKHYSALLFGYNRIGFNVLRSIKKIKKKYLVIDFNPDTIATLNKMRIPCLYGDVYDSELLEELPLDKIELAISTVPDFETNELLVESIRLVNPNAVVITRAHSIEDAFELYKKGSSYVLTPHFLGGDYIAKMVSDLKVNSKAYEKERSKHLKILKERFVKGQKHPQIEKD